MPQDNLHTLITSLSQLPQVEAVALGGSHTVNMHDALSDYDLYVYTSAEIPIKIREKITEESCDYIELNNQFWETEDDGILKNGTEIDIIYRSLAWLDQQLSHIVFNHQASVGYSSCFWFNLLNSHITFDREQQLNKLKSKYSIPYPEALAKNIVAKNAPLLSSSIACYPKQIEKAIKRNDRISVNHRVAAYLASYFDVLFAINKLPHPGEKRMLTYSQARCSLLPEGMSEDINAILDLAANNDLNLISLLKENSEKLLQLA